MTHPHSATQLVIKEVTDNIAPHEVGHVRVGTVDIYKTSVGNMDNNCYFLVDYRAPEKATLIDAANDAEHLKALAQQLRIRVTTIITTHSHGDHVQALPELMHSWASHGVRHITSAADADDIQSATGIAADRMIEQGDTVTVGKDVHLEVSICRGHTKGGACFALRVQSSEEPTHIFVGDCLFPGGVGATKTPAAFNQLLDDVTQRIFQKYSDDTVIHPGHGDGTTLGAERPNLQRWRVRGW